MREIVKCLCQQYGYSPEQVGRMTLPQIEMLASGEGYSRGVTRQVNSLAEAFRKKPT